MNKKPYFAVSLASALILLVTAAVRAQTPQTLTLKQAVTLALQNSPDLSLARVRYNVARSETGVARSEFHPNLYTGSGAAYTNGFPQTPGGAAPSVFELSYTQALFNPLKKGAERADEDRAKNQELEYENMRDTVMVRAASNYLELAEVRHKLDLLESERESGQKIFDVVRQRAAAGLELPVDVTREELKLAQIEQQIVGMQSRDEILTDQLRDMTGLPADQPIEVTAEELAPGPTEPAAELIEEAVSRSPAIKEAENERSAREHLLKGAHGAYWPTIDLIGEYSVLSKFNNYALFFNHFQRNNVNAGVQISIPIFSARTAANAALARNQLTAAELDLSQRRRDVRIGVEEKIRQVRELDAAKEVARLDLKLAQQMLDITQAKFDQGRATLSDLEQARLVENDKWLAFLDADLSREKAQLELLQSTGELAQVFH